MLRACLAFVLLTCAVSPVLAQNGHSESCDTGASSSSDRSASTGTSALRGKRTATPPQATSQAGGSDDDSDIRLRIPKWDSLLPGMFR